VSSETFKGKVSIFSIGVDKTTAELPQPENKTAIKAAFAINFNVLMELLDLVVFIN
jgi:hypothetical protein